MWKIPSIKELAEAGVAFGHKTTKRHPRMAPFIDKIQGTVHLINLEKTREKLKEALRFAEETAKSGGVILFVGTKPSAKEIIKKYAETCQMPYVTNKWIAGTLTNFETISELIKKYLRMKEEKEKNEWSKYTKKEALDRERELQRLERMVGGIKSLERIPDALYLVDIIEEKTAIRECLRKKIKTIAMVDTNANPEKVTYPIPANDDARKSIDIITSLIAQAIMTGKEKTKKTVKKTETPEKEREKIEEEAK